MSEDIESKINQIKELLGKEGMSDNLKNMMNLFSKQKQSSGDTKGDAHKDSHESGIPFDTDTLQMFLKIKSVLEHTSKNDDPRTKLLSALKPYLSNKRQTEVGNCLNMLKITNILSALTKSEGSDKNAHHK